MSRRVFLRASVVAGAGLGVGGGGILAGAPPPPWGPLVETPDRTTGLPLLRLPAGFSYATWGWTGDPLPGDVPTPPEHDGMGVVRVAGSRATLVRNHEVRGAGAAFARGPVYDASRAGGTTTLDFDLDAGRWEPARVSLAGTAANCAGGVTPWGTWLTCEESVARGDAPHGFVYEVPADGHGVPEPLVAMGRFNHEAVAVDPATSIVYETEDHERCGFYRFVPTAPGDLRRGGRLQMLRVPDRSGVRLARWDRVGEAMSVDWVDIDEPARAHAPLARDANGVFWQGRLQGAATFRRLEGCWWGDGGVYFLSTDGGPAGAGQIWHHHVGRSQLRLVLQAGGRCDLDRPDGGACLPSDAWLVSEDCGRRPARLVAVSASGAAWPFAENTIVLAGERNAIEGDYGDGAWTGLTFAGKWLFANIERPGLTVAITGPWDRLRPA